jgi:nickel/cobalt exporter
VTRRLVVSLALASALLMLAASTAGAHPLGNFTVSRFSRLLVGPESVTIRYAFDMAEIPAFQEREVLDADGDETISRSELADYARRIAPRLRASVTLTADGDRVDLEVASSRARLFPGQGGLEVLRVDATFVGELAEPAAELTYRDDTFPGRIGWREIVASATEGQGIVASSVPAQSISHGLRSYPRDRLSSPLDVETAELSVRPGATTAGSSGAGGAVGATEPIDALASAFASLVQRRVGPGFLFLALAVALAAGALHALGPGHGKTVMAAYLVGADARVRHAVAVGVAVSLMHTASVVVLGLVTLWGSNEFAPETVYPWLSLASGVVVLVLGTWLLAVRLRARRAAQRALGHQDVALQAKVDQAPAANHALALAGAPAASGERHDGLQEHDHIDHFHGGHDRTVTHGNAHARGLLHHHSGPPPSMSPVSARGLAAVALSGGLLPSPSALVVLLGAVALHRIALGVFLVGAFSVGLAAALTGVGVLLLKARPVVDRRLAEGIGNLLPVLSAAAIVAVGLFLTGRAVAAF